MHSHTIVLTVLISFTVAFPNPFRKRHSYTIPAPGYPWWNNPYPTPTEIIYPTPMLPTQTPTPSGGSYRPEYTADNIIFYHFNDDAGRTYYEYCEPKTEICPLDAEGCPFICGAPQENSRNL